MSAVVNALERRGRGIRDRLVKAGGGNADTPLGWLEAQIAFWVEQLEQKKRRQEDLRLELVRTECKVGTDLLQATSKYNGGPPSEPGLRERLKGRLLEIERERRLSESHHARDASAIHEKLLGLLVQHAQLAGTVPLHHDESRYNPGETRAAASR